LLVAPFSFGGIHHKHGIFLTLGTKQYVLINTRVMITVWILLIIIF